MGTKPVPVLTGSSNSLGRTNSLRSDQTDPPTEPIRTLSYPPAKRTLIHRRTRYNGRTLEPPRPYPANTLTPPAARSRRYLEIATGQTHNRWGSHMSCPALSYDQ